ncbi:MAG: hypothetical protein IKQ29_03780 [Bacilli bacterium]|nr:hypothetical protein [Bacilli bacterium]
MANVKKKSSTSKAKKSVKKVEKEKDLVLDEDLDEEVLEDDDFNLDDDEDDELALLETELEEVSGDERLIRVEKLTKANTVMLVICIILVIITMGICININKGDSKDTTKKDDNSSETENESSGDNTYSTAAFKTIKMKDIASESKNKEIIVFLGRQGCYWCGLYAPVLGLASEENKFDVYYLDFGSMVDFTVSPPTVADDEEYEALTTFIGNSAYSAQIAEGIGTPMTMFVKNNKIVNFIGGYVDATTLNTYLKKEGFVK